MSKNNIYIIFLILLSFFSNINAQINVACAGNSITEGVGLPNINTQSYPAQLGVLLGSDYSVQNLGHGGTTILKNSGSPYQGTSEYFSLISHNRDVVIICFGTNDAIPINWDNHSDEFEEDYLDLIALCNAPGDPPQLSNRLFILCFPPPIHDGTWERNNTLVNEIIPKIRNVANQTGAYIADFYNPMLDHPAWFQDDLIHPNEAGAAVMANIVYDVMIYALVPKTPTGLITISGLNSITLNWDANPGTDISYYRVYRLNNSVFTFDWIGNVQHPETTYVDTLVDLGQIYYYAIKAVNKSGFASARTSSVAGSTLDVTAPATPVNLQVIHKPDTVLVTWNPNTEPDLAYYNIYRNINETDLLESTILISSVDGRQNYYNDILIEDATTYYYGITALDTANNQSTISGPIGITTSSHPVSADTVLIFHDSVPHSFSLSDFPFYDADNDFLDKIMFIHTNHFEYFSYNGNNFNSTITCNDISKLTITPKADEYGQNYAKFSFKVIDSFGSTSLDTNIVIIHINDKPHDFNIITPNNDSTFVINKFNYLTTFSIRWEESSDSLNGGILYNIIFNGDLLALSRDSITSTNIEYVLKEILAVTDTVSIANGAFSVIASDGNLETVAKNSNIALTIDGRSFAPVKLHLDQNYPNPFNHDTVIGFDLPNSTNISIIIYDLLGEEVIKLVNNKKYERGYNKVTWNSLDKHNKLITAGIYIMQIRMGNEEQHKKLIFLK